MDRGDHAEAAKSFSKRLAISGAMPNGQIIPGDFRLGAELLAGLDRFETAPKLMGAADAAMNEIGAVRWPKSETEATELRDRLRERMGGEAFDSA